MTLFHVAVRGLRHYAGTAFATSAGVAVAACVIGGSIIAGDSVTATLRRSALARLGSADYAVAAAHPISHVLARALADTPGVTTAAPVLIRNGSAQNADTDATAPRVQVIGAGPEFSALYPANRRVPSLEPREAAVSAALASDIGLTVGSGFILRVATGSGEPVSSIFARRALSDAIRTMRVECKAILPPDGPGGFSLGVESGARRNVIVDADWLAGQLDGDRVVDAVLLDADTVAARGAIGKVVRDSSAPADFGLAIEVDAPRGAVLVRGTDVTIPAARAEALLGGNRSAAVPAGTAGSIMLATRLASARGAAHYAVVGHVPTVPVEEDRIVLNRWLADDLRAEAGGTINVEWLRPKPDGSYEPQSRRMIVSRIVAVEAAAEQQWIAPQFKGITDSERMTDWDPPFPVDLSLITPRDDLYWDRYRTTPKAFVSREAIRRMWGAEGASGEWVTAVRFGLGLPRAQGSGSDLRALSAAVEGLVRTDARIREGGPIVRPIREEALVAARGSSDFRGLMLGMSMFIVASGIALAGMLMRLSAERRASQMGVMLAMGFAPSSAARVTVIEGGFAALGGALIGAVLGAPFAAALVRALNSWWAGAVAGEPIVLTVGPGGPLIGACAAFGLGMAAAWASARRLVRSDVLRLLAGWRAMSASGIAQRGRSGRRALVAWSAVVIVSVVTILAGGRVASEALAALAGGALLLIGGLGLLGAWLSRLPMVAGKAEDLTIRRIALRNASLRRGQSVLVAGIIAGAAFLLVVVASNVRSGAAMDVRDVRSGTGGFTLIARSSVPLTVGFDTPKGRANLGFDQADEAAFDGVEVVPFLLSPGVDASCLNLARPTAPRVLGVSQRMIERGGFSVQTARRGAANPWEALNRPSVGRTIAAFGDAESVRWILQSGLGGSVARETPSGAFTLRFVGLIPFSIFAGEVLVSEPDYRAMFPGHDAPSYFLIRTPPGAENAVAAALRRNLGDAGMEVRTTREALSELLTVQNTYLSAFLVLGGLGIALGTAGLGAVLLRSAYERRGELALMAALGFRRRDLVAMVALESVGLLVFGALLGTVAALAASVSRIASGEAAVNWAALVGAIGAMVVVGLASCVGAAIRGVAGRTLDAIRSE